MKKIIKIKSKNKDYNIILENNSIIRNIKKYSNKNQKNIIVIDYKLADLYKRLKNNKNNYIIRISGGEKIKTLESYSNLCNKILKMKIDRSFCLISIGGGTIGDLCGFVASTLLRGIKFILVPSTLLSQVDSSIGGKNGINTIHGKNLIGTFFQPDYVIIDPLVLKTLSKREVKSGYAEIIKHALIKDKNFFMWLDKNYSAILNLNPYYIAQAIIRSIKIKSIYVQKDEKENLINSNSRAILNFGHTFGHALETMNNYNNDLTHGEAIAIGMSLASKISYKIGLMSYKEYNIIITHLDKIKLPFYDKRIKDKKLYKLMLSDKKNTDNQVNLILIKNIGKAIFKRNIKMEDIKRILN